MIEYPHASPATPTRSGMWMVVIAIDERTGYMLYRSTEKEANDDAAKEVARLKES